MIPFYTYLKMRSPNATRAELFKLGVWTTSNGRRIHKSKIDSGHLSNISGCLFKMARANARQLKECGYRVPIIKLYQAHPFARHIADEFKRRRT